MERVKQRDAAGLEALYDRYSALVYGIAMRIMEDAPTAEDATQIVFLKIWNSPRSFASGNFAAWISRVTRNHCLDVLRGQARHPESDFADAAAEIEDTVAEAAFAHLDARSVHAALQNLSPEQRKLIELAYFGGMSQQRIAERTGIPLGTIKTRIRTALQRLRGFLDGMQAP